MTHGLNNPRLLALRPGSKAPDTERHPHGHHDAVRGLHVDGNYGIVLDGEYIVVDIDKPKDAPLDLPAKLTPTWSQLTPKGIHHLYTLPPGFKAGNAKLVNDRGVVYGDLKTRGYIVGPGSVVDGKTYILETSRTPAPAPSAILDLLKQRSEPAVLTVEGHGVGPGAQDDAIQQLAGWIHAKFNPGEERLVQLLSAVPDALFDGVDPANPFTEADFRRHARSVMRHPGGNLLDTSVSLNETTWTCGADVDLGSHVVRWLLYRFIPRGELTLIYGAGGIGKSSAASFFAALALLRGMRTAISSHEEPFKRFVMRVYLSNDKAPLDNIFDIGNRWTFPSCADKLKELILDKGIDFLYFDSIYNHIDSNLEKLNAAERTRHALTPLARIAQETGCTILGTFHENKGGNYMGSTEMENVVRSLLHMTRKSKDGPTRLRVKKTNFTRPDHDLLFSAESVPAHHPPDEPWMEENEHGQDVPSSIVVIRASEHAAPEDEESEDESRQDARFVENRDEIQSQVRDMHRRGMTGRQIASEVGVSPATVSRMLQVYPDGLPYTP